MHLIEIIEYIIDIEHSAFFYTPKIYKNGKSILFKKPVVTITAKNRTEFFSNLKSINSILEKGLTGYGLINYETGYLLEEKLIPLFKESHESILTFHFFEKDQIQYFGNDEINYSDVKDVLSNENFSVSNFHLNTPEEIYKKNIEKIRDYIKEGDTYQINYTVKGKFEFSGSIKSLFLNLIFNQSAEYSALINTGEGFIISISPELFFDVKGKSINAKPMKGTIKRGLTTEEDKIKVQTLLNSKKDKAENIMIVDLLRNDLGRISEFNSVKVASKFDIEKYESLFQMTSKVEAELKEKNFEEIIKNIPNGIYYLAVAYIVWKAAHFYFVRFRDIEKKVCDVDGIKKKIDDEIGPVLVKINSTSDRIARYIITKDSLNPAFFSTFAKEVLTESGAKNFIDNSFAFLSSKIEERNPKSTLDIQQLAISVVFDLVDTEAFSKVKDFVYNNPKYKEQGIDMPIIINIAALYFRDEYFKKHPELKEADLK